MLSNICDSLIRLDHIVWYYINVQWHNAFLDFVVPYLRNPFFWAPLYLFLLIFMPSRFRLNGWLWCAAFIITFAMADQVSATFMKPYFHRLRPCHNPYLQGMIHLLVDCGGEYGFPSVHATNHFALGIFSAVTLGKQAKWVWPVAIIWATLVSFAQVYVGVHFPLDVTCGALVGTAIGILTGKIFNRFLKLEKSVSNQPIST